ncbi:MAG: hypothetical protein K0Q89_41 [Thermomicrobiales bacterium]|jgi:hypothetical protein|nr:hypothetical protein [Thermomicrobiales bacterium]
MKTLTDHLLPHAAAMDEYFVRGASHASRHERGLAMKLYQAYREKRGFTGPALRLLTWPADNDKLLKGKVPSYGLTLQHTTTRVKRGLIVNACPHAGDCQKVCVLDNGNGSFEAVKEARRAKVDFLCEQPRAFAFLLGWELEAAWTRHWKTNILFRPNVNSDVRWDLILPSLTNGDTLGTRVLSYGYTKDPFVLDTDGWVGATYRLAYSWNENSDQHAVFDFVERGGSVAVVTSRRKGQKPEPIWLGGNVYWANVVDADLTDEWMFQEGVIGDLSAKGRARQLIGKSGFVVTTGGT